jgi:hypothetical protein
MLPRSQMDKPATLIAAIAGMLIIAGSAWALPSLYCKSPSASCQQAAPGEKLAFDVHWRSTTFANQTVSIAAAPADGAATLTAGTEWLDALHVTVAAGACKDTHDAKLEKPARVTLNVTFAGHGATRQIGNSTSFECSQVQKGLDLLIPLNAQPDLAQITADNATAAQASIDADEAGMATPGAYRLDVHVIRPAGTLPVANPAAPTTFSIELGFTASQWQDTLTPQPKQQVGK